MSRTGKIIAAALVGAFIGSYMGIAAMGSAIAGTVPLALLMAYLAHLWTKDSQPDADAVPPPLEAKTEDPWKEMEKAAQDSVPVVLRFLAASWNLCMKGLVHLGVMQHARRRPWLLAALIILIMAVIPPLGIYLLVTGIVAAEKGASAENDFMVSYK